MRAHGRKHEIGKRFAILIGLAATGVIALGAQTGAAATDVVSYETRLTMTYEGGRYFGSVWSEGPECRLGRRVILFRMRPGRDRKLGATTTHLDPDGAVGWGMDASSFGRVWAKVERKVGDGFVCRADNASEDWDRITIWTESSSALTGAIKSSRKFCRLERLVVIKRDTPAKDPIIARDRTSRTRESGAARYLADVGRPVTGYFYARAPRKIGFVSGNRIVCRPLQSDVIHVD